MRNYSLKSIKNISKITAKNNKNFIMKIQALIRMTAILFAMTLVSCGWSEDSSGNGRSDYESSETSLAGITGKWVESHREPASGCLFISVLTIKSNGNGHFIMSASCGVAQEEIVVDDPIRIERDGEKLFVYLDGEKDTFYVRKGVVCTPDGKEMRRSH